MNSKRYLMPNPSLMRSTATRLRALAVDLEAAAAGDFPDTNALRDAPVLDFWSFGERADLCLLGARGGHPVLGGDGRLTRTSSLYIVDYNLGIARTLSRWYRLGRELGHQSLLS